MTAPLAKTRGVPDGHRAQFVRVGPHDTTGAPCLAVVYRDGRTVTISFDPAHAHALAERILECVDGRISSRPPSRRVLEIELAEDP